MRKMYSQKQIELMAKEIADAVAEGFLEDVIEGAEAGTLVNLLGLDSDGGLKKQAVGDAVIDVVAGVEAGTIQDVLGLDENGDVVKGSAGGGGGYYLHTISWRFSTNTSPNGVDVRLVNKKSTPYADIIDYYTNQNNDSPLFNSLKDFVASFDSTSVIFKGLAVTYHPETSSYEAVGVIQYVITSSGYSAQQISKVAEISFTDTVTPL